MINRWQPWFAGSAGFAAALSIRFGSLRSGLSGARGGAHGLSSPSLFRELCFAVLVWRHDESRSTRGPGCLTTSDGSYDGPSLVRARSPEFARNAGCLATRTMRDPGLRTGSTPALVRMISIDRSKCSTGPKGTTSRVCRSPALLPLRGAVCAAGLTAPRRPPPGRRGASWVHPGHGRRRCSASARRASCSGLFFVTFRNSVVLTKNVVAAW